ncbi:uncharacterized protein EDB91DRAFT_1142876 [Suillus paluster]|uniref:uncharacterized protein n=1 Tax=Suillus paluster TaxID=48578 RepID=UPI001B862319|nr:uncharacterized protein EDB91DRAFT_1142876 [Suillus paluster]KAG1736108.1 hypothetical protein EDB91DRAFT_1142876 [Suillus paluster]
MPRSSRSSRPAAKPAAPAPTQSRGAHTAAMPPAAAHGNPAHAPAPPVPAQTSSGPGMMAQMAATAGSVAVGSTIGHGISSMLFGSSSSAAPAEPAAPTTGAACEIQAKEFTKCLDKADLQSCSWYLEQLKACQAAAAPY